MILVTGAAGRLGRRVVRRLVEQGHEVLGTDRVSYVNSPTPYLVEDLRDRRKARELSARADAIVHMGAIPGPTTKHDAYEKFENNVLSTFNIMRAAADHQIRRIVFSSSAFAMGWASDPTAFVPLYLPLDEQHPMMPFESYGLSKQIGECIAQMIARTTKTSVVSLRFANVVSLEDQAAFPLPPPTPEHPATVVMWSYADPRDVADAHVAALDADIKGHEAFLIAQPITRFREATAGLIERNFAGRVEIRGALGGNAGVISTEKAGRMLGFVPKHRWTDPHPDWH